MVRQILLGAIGLCIVCSSAPTAAQGGGTISGTVVDDQGATVVGANVIIDHVDKRISFSIVKYIETDSEGHFSTNGLAWDKYKIFAMKPSSGYPNTSLSFYGNDSFQEVTITPSAPAAEVRIRLGPKAGMLSGDVTDAQTGAPVNASFKLTRVASPGDWLSTSQSSAYQVLLPAATDILIQVFAPGYKTWASSGPLRLQSGEKMHLDITLERPHNPRLPSSEFLIPDGYVGWLRVECNVKRAPATAAEKNIRMFKFPKNGTLVTSSGVPEEAAEKRYLYYTTTGFTKDVLTDYRHGHGMVWGAAYGFKNGVISEFFFFVGTEERYKKQGYRGLQSPNPHP